MMQHLEPLFRHIKEIVDAKISFIYVMYIYMGTTWGSFGDFTYHWELNDN